MSIFPFIDASGVTDTKKVTDLPLLKEYAYDYARNELLLDENGCTYLVEGNAALRIWIFKALTTARFRHVAYSPAFGEEYEDQLIGHSMNGEIVLQSEKIKGDIEKYNRLKLECYEDYKNELITQDEYLLFKKELDNRIEDTKKAATELSKKKRMLLDGRYEKESFMEKFLTSKDIELKRSLFVRFISQIYVYEDHRIEIMFRYQDEIKQLARLVEEIRNDVALGEVI